MLLGPNEALHAMDGPQNHRLRSPRTASPLERHGSASVVCLPSSVFVTSSAMPFALRGPTRPCGFRFGRTAHAVRSRFESGAPLTKKHVASSLERHGRGADDFPRCLVMRPASQLHCPWSETGSTPVRGAALQRATCNVTRAVESWRPAEPPNLGEKVRFLHGPPGSKHTTTTRNPRRHGAIAQ